MRIPVILLVISYVTIFLMDWYIWNDIKIFSCKSFFRVPRKKKSPWALAFLIFSGLVVALFTVAICLPHRDQNGDLQTKMWLLYTFLTVYFSELIYLICSLAGFVSLVFRRPRVNTGLWIGLPLALLTCGLMWWGTAIGRKQIEIKTHEIISPKVPASFDGYKIVQLSDLHVGTWGSDTLFISRLVDSINAQKPDLIVFTGDIVNRKTDEVNPFVNTLTRLKAKDGVLAVLGNHDYGDYITWNSLEEKRQNMKSLEKFYETAGWNLLNNSRKFITNERNDTIVLIGVENWGEPPFHQYGKLDKAYPVNPDSTYNVNDERFKILLSHNPEHWNRVISNTTNIDLTLSGHTHAMQIMFQLGPFRWSPSEYKYEQWSGLYERTSKRNEKLRLYVNIGAGEVGLPMRIGATPEITTFILRHD